MTKKQIKNVFVGLDPGFGNTKACVDGQTEMLQTAVARPTDVGMATIGLKVDRRIPFVEMNGQKYHVGHGAWRKGRPITSLDYLAITSPERTALFYAALSKLLPPAEENVELTAALVVGLPVPLLRDTAQANAVMAALKNYKGQHEFVVSGETFAFTVEKIKVLAQPVGAYMNWLYSDDLVVRSGGSKAEVAVIDIGLNTLDLFVIEGGQVLEWGIGGREVGVRRLLQILQSNGHDLVELDARLRNGALKPDAPHLEAWLGEILAAVSDVWPNLARFTTILPVGGGAVVLGERLIKALRDKGANIDAPVDPLIANVRGFWKFSRKVWA